MFEFLGRGKNKSGTAGEDHGPDTHLQTVQLDPTRIEVVRMALDGVLKLHGIPVSWIAVEVVPVRIPGKGEALLLQLEVKHWHDALVLHAPALEQALLVGLHGFDPTDDETRYLLSWQFAPDCGCPHTRLPEPGFWTSGKPAALAQDDTDDDDDHGFAATQAPEQH